MIALAAKNAILIVEIRASTRARGDVDRRCGVLRRHAADSGRSWMTSFAFISGVVPLMTATGAGAASQQSLGTVVFGGMLASTLLAIPFVSVFFVAVHGADKPKRSGIGRSCQTSSCQRGGERMRADYCPRPAGP